MIFFETTASGKCDVTITLFTKENSILLQRSRTYYAKPTFKELKAEFKNEGASYMRITTTPGWNVKTIKL